MSVNQETSNFIRAAFRSIWSLELLLHLRNHPERSWSTPELVEQLRSSESVVSQSCSSLVAAGLIVVDDHGARYNPATPETDRLVAATEKLYAKRPDAVRRLIVQAANDGLAAFADAFRLGKE